MGLKSFVKSIAKLLTEEKSSANRTLDEVKVLEHGKVKADKAKALNSNDVQSSSINTQALTATSAVITSGVIQAATNDHFKTNLESALDRNQTNELPANNSNFNIN